MANAEHLGIVQQGKEALKAWREQNPTARLDLRQADLHGGNLRGLDLSEADLSEADLSGADLSEATLLNADLTDARLINGFLSGANLHGATLWLADLSETNLSNATLSYANLIGANLLEAKLTEARLFRANLSEANLSKANLSEASLRWADLSRANLSEANLWNADLTDARLNGAELIGADLRGARFLGTEVEGAKLRGCHVYGISAWGLKGVPVEQSELVITPHDQPELTVDNLKVAQFLYLLLNNPELQAALDTITSKAVLILGRFTEERKAVLDALRVQLRGLDYIPILFDFARPQSKDYGGTVATLARLARFVIVDVTDAKVVLDELRDIRDLGVPIQLILLQGAAANVTLMDSLKFPWVLPPHVYPDQPSLLASLAQSVIGPAEAKAQELRVQRDAFEAQLLGLSQKGNGA